MTNGPYPNHLAEFMRASRLTDPALARKLDISKQQIFNLRRWHRKLTVEWAKRIAPYLDVSWERLITGPPAPADQARTKWSEFFDALDEEQRQALLVVASGMARRDSDPAASPRSNDGPDPPVPFQEGGNVKENPARETPVLPRPQPSVRHLRSAVGSGRT